MSFLLEPLKSLATLIRPKPLVVSGEQVRIEGRKEWEQKQLTIVTEDVKNFVIPLLNSLKLEAGDYCICQKENLNRRIVVSGSIHDKKFVLLTFQSSFIINLRKAIAVSDYFSLREYAFLIVSELNYLRKDQGKAAFEKQQQSSVAALAGYVITAAITGIVYYASRPTSSPYGVPVAFLGHIFSSYIADFAKQYSQCQYNKNLKEIAFCSFMQEPKYVLIGGLTLLTTLQQEGREMSHDFSIEERIHALKFFLSGKKFLILKDKDMKLI